MKVLMLNGSPNANGNTATALREMEKTFLAEGVEVEIVHVGHLPIRGCIGCRKYAKFSSEQFTVTGALASVNYETEVLPGEECVEKIQCPTGALLSAREHHYIEKNDPDWKKEEK